MIDRFRTRLARLIIRHLAGPRELVIRAWLWLAADTDDVEVKWLCLHAVLELNPEHQAALAASALLFQREVKRLQRESLADNVRRCYNYRQAPLEDSGFGTVFWYALRLETGSLHLGNNCCCAVFATSLQSPRFGS